MRALPPSAAAGAAPLRAVASSPTPCRAPLPPRATPRTTSDDLAKRAAAALESADAAYHGGQAGGVSPLSDDVYDSLKAAAVAAGVVQGKVVSRGRVCVWRESRSDVDGGKTTTFCF